MNFLARPAVHDSLAYQLKTMRRATGMSVAALAQLADLSSDTIAALEQIESGQVQSLLTIVKQLGGVIAGVPDEMPLGAWLADLRRSRGLGQRAAAEQAALSQPTVIALKRSRGSMASLAKVLALYGVPLRLRSKAAPYDGLVVGRRIAHGDRFELHDGDCRERLKTFAEEGRRFHGCLTDPPYEVTSWDRSGLAFDPAL